MAENTRIVSPDGKRWVLLTRLDNENRDDFPADMTVSGDGREIKMQMNFASNAEVLWSPDSQAFAVTGSAGGGNGPYETTVYSITPSGLIPQSLTRIVYRLFGNPVRCGWPEYPNVGAIAWSADSTALVVAAQIVEHSNCDSFGTFKAYKLRVSDGVPLHTYGQLEAKKLFRQDLGDWLKDARDECIRDPWSCWVEANHQPRAKSKKLR